MKFYLLTTLFCFFLGASMTSAQNVDLKKSAKLLSSKSAQTQLKAEKQLKASGYDALKHIVPLMYDKNEKVEKRARRIYAWIMFGLNDSIPHEICEKIYRFGKLNADEKLALIEQCSKLKTKHPFMLAALHSRVLETLPQNKRDREKLKKKASSALTINLTNKNFKPEEFDPRLLMVETRAIVMSDVWRLGRDVKIQQVYEAWFKIDSKIRNYLTSTGVIFELKRLEKVENPHKELVFYNALVSSYAKKMVKSKMSPKWHSKIPFKLTDLNEAEAIAYLDIVVSDGNEMKRLKDFKLLQKKFPTLVQKMPTHLKVLEVHFLLELKQFYPAFELAMKIQMESKTALKCWRDLGVWANKNPDSLTNGLPHAPVKLARQMKLFIEGLTSVTQNQPVKITEEKMKLFSDLINRSEAKIAEEWMMLLRDYHVYHYIWLSAIRGKLDSVITHFESVRNRTAIYTLGRVISKNTALSEQIVAKNHHVKTMEILVTTIWNGIRDGYPSFQKCDKIIIEWEKAHPELLKQSKLSGAILFLASRHWQQGKREQAVEKLIGKRGNAYRASWLLIHLLEKTPAAEVKELLSGVEVPASFMKVMIKHYLEDKKVTIDKARQLITVWSLNLNKGRNLSYSLSYLARTYAYQLWRLGQTDLAYLVLQNAFWDDADKQERYIGLFPEFALTVGKINEAIAYGDTLKVKQAKNRHSLKMAYLYRAAGDLKQANAHVKEFPNTKLRTKLAILSKDWNAALQSLSVKTNRSNKEYQISLNAWYAYIQGDEKKALAEYARLKKPNKWMMLTVSDKPSDRLASSMRVNRHLVEKKLKTMALDSYVIEMSEKVLRAELKAKKPVKYAIMLHYVRYAKSLPNQKNAAELLYQLGQQPSCYVKIAADAKNRHWAHKMLALKTLNSMGKIELRDKLLKETLSRNKNLLEVPWFSRSLLLGIVFSDGNWFPDSLIKTLQAETPNQSGDKRILLLEKIFQQKDRVANVVKLLEIARRQEKKMTRLENADIVNFCSIYLGEKMRVRTKLVLLKGDIFDAVKLEYKPRLKKAVQKNTERSITTNAKLHNNPLKDEFSMPNGIAHALELWNAGEKEAAQKQIEAITIRVLLLDDQSKRLTIRSRNRRETAPYKAEEMALICYRILKLPEELIGTSLDSIVRKPAFSSVDEKCHWAAEIAESHGDFPKALTYYHLYAERIMFVTYGDFTEIITRFHALEMICAAQEGNMKKVIFHAQQRMKVRPYDNLLLPETLKILREKGDTKTIQALDATIKTFWKNKLTELPNYEPYTQALKAWQEMVK